MKQLSGVPDTWFLISSIVSSQVSEFEVFFFFRALGLTEIPGTMCFITKVASCC